MFHRILRQLIVILCLLLVLAACSNEEPTPAPTIAPTVAAPAPTATPTAAQPESPINAPTDSPLPTPGTVTVTAAVTTAEKVNEIPLGEPVNAKTTATTGAATGRIFIQNTQGFRPVTNVFVALALVIKGPDGVEKAAGYNPAVAPRNEIRDDGTLIIENVPPGRYGVILDAVLSSIMLMDSENLENSLVITIEADKVTDLGTLIYESLALPGLTE